MEYQNQTVNINQTPTRPKTPIIVIIISVLILLSGIGSLLSTLIILLFNPLAGLLNLIIGVGMIVVAVGLWRMHKWSLYVFFFFTIL